MFPPRSEEEVTSFPLTKWKIREPPEELARSREDGVTEGDIDVVVVPGVAFDASCNRLGHGRGHYGESLCAGGKKSSTRMPDDIYRRYPQRYDTCRSRRAL